MKSKDQIFDTKFQFTAKTTPQRNIPVEKKLDTLTGRGISMMNAANRSSTERCKLFKYAFNTATLFDGLTIIVRKGLTKTRFDHWGNELPKFSKYLRTWGEA